MQNNAAAAGPLQPTFSLSLRDLIKFWNTVFLRGEVVSLKLNPQPGGPEVSLFVQVITFNLSGMGDPTSSLATPSIAVSIIWPQKLHHNVQVGITLGGGGCRATAC